jgi:hypothetical protein
MEPKASQQQPLNILMGDEPRGEERPRLELFAEEAPLATVLSSASVLTTLEYPRHFIEFSEGDRLFDPRSIDALHVTGDATRAEPKQWQFL